MVDFVGAGCGAADLITLRGKRLIEEADVIIYAGSLVNPELLGFAKESCEVHNSAYMDLDQVISVMVKAEADGKKIVRLHTGDPSVYGAIREQMDRLDKLGIDYNVCPGVSSFCGAAAALKAEYTLPEVSQTVIITRMAGRTPVPEKESIDRVIEAAKKAAGILPAAKIDRNKLVEVIRAALEQVKNTGEVEDAIDAVTAAARKAAGF
ncbi:MAG: Cobalt-precorrin-4 C(11)-methyltransferase [Firmicutes bacterium ADurb.BinA205]|nr:MAG: Cobalt-precorrin-4 C(11)-methyltransferase [Firmicutes bacterium ADurb.BinA205]